MKRRRLDGNHIQHYSHHGRQRSVTSSDGRKRNKKSVARLLLEGVKKRSVSFIV